jgi:hypothetical protein
MALQLHVRVVEACNFATGGTVKMDPICTLTVFPGNETKKTKPLFNNPRPQWNEEFHFNLTVPAQSVLTVTLCNKDPIANIPLSRVQVNLFELPLGQVFDSSYPLTALKKMKSPGEVRLMIQVAPAGMQPWVAPQQAPYPARPTPLLLDLPGRTHRKLRTRLRTRLKELRLRTRLKEPRLHTRLKELRHRTRLKELRLPPRLKSHPRRLRGNNRRLWLRQEYFQVLEEHTGWALRHPLTRLAPRSPKDPTLATSVTLLSRSATN